MDEPLLDVARSIRPYLPELLGDRAEECDRQLARLLSDAAAGADVSPAIAEVLAEHPPALDWAARVLEDDLHRPPDLQPYAERSIDLPGEARPVHARRYECPVDGNYVWWRRSVGVPVRSCPEHGVQLVPSAT